jgi:hypothetical protein
MSKIDKRLYVVIFVVVTGLCVVFVCTPIIRFQRAAVFRRSAPNIHGAGASLAGVIMPNTADVGGRTLLLNGLGLRSEFMVKIYVAGLYLEQKSSDSDAIIKTSTSKRIVMQFIHGVSKDQLVDSFAESLTNNSPDATNNLKADTDLLLGALESVKSGDQMVFTFLPDAGTTFTLNGHVKLTIADPAFSTAVFSVWLGPRPPTALVKKGLLGQ